MALYKSLLRPISTSLCHSCLMQLMKKEGASLKQITLNYNRRQFKSSIAKGGKWQLKNVKPIEMQLMPEKSSESFPKFPHSLSLLLKPFLFTVAFSGASFAGTAIWQYENIRVKALTLLQKNWFTDKFFTYGKKKFNWRQELNKKWNCLSESEKLFAPICFLNILVFLAWKVKRFQPIMINYFCSSPFNANVCWPMILTAFSHYSFFHLAANMYVLYSFSNSGVKDLGKEQFLGLYLAGAVISSFTSYVYKILKMQHALSVGASGAIMAMIAYICVKYPDSKLSIILLPWIVFSAGSGIKFIMGLDILGALRGWTYFDHAAHLGGSLCGIGWCYWGNTYIWQKREPLLEWWHELRSPK